MKVTYDIIREGKKDMLIVNKYAPIIEANINNPQGEISSIMVDRSIWQKIQSRILGYDYAFGKMKLSMYKLFHKTVPGYYKLKCTEAFSKMFLKSFLGSLKRLKYYQKSFLVIVL